MRSSDLMGGWTSSGSTKFHCAWVANISRWPDVTLGWRADPTMKRRNMQSTESIRGRVLTARSVAALVAAALLAVSCGDDPDDLTTAGAVDEASGPVNDQPVSSAGPLHEVALIEDLDPAVFELRCPPGDSHDSEDSDWGELTVEAIERDHPTMEPTDAVGAVTSRLEEFVVAFPATRTRVDATAALLVEVMPPSSVVELSPDAEERQQREAEAETGGDGALVPDLDLDGPQPAGDTAARYPVVEPAPAPPEEGASNEQTSALRYATVVAPVDPSNPSGPYLLRADVAIVGDKYAVVTSMSSCGIVTVSLEDQKAFRDANPAEGLENDQ